ncbi:MAG: hypothetical protein FWH24_06170 [Oscillospiraceae bacterium]|nr:hypothetical protein [Oscillospiraceae bacterium]
MFFDETHSLDFHELIKKRIKKTAVIIIAAALLLTVVRIVLTVFYVDPVNHFYTPEHDMFIRIFDWTAAGGVIALYFISVFLYRYKKAEHHYSAVSVFLVQGTQTQVFSASVAGFMLVASAILQVWRLFGNNELPAAQILAGFARNNTFDFLIFFASVFSAVYFFVTAWKEHKPEENDGKYSQKYIILSLMPIMWSFLHTFKCFFDMGRSINSPVRIYELMSFLAMSTYFVSESRMIVGRRRISRFFTFAYIALIFIFFSALPNLVLSSLGLMQTGGEYILYAVQLAAAFYIITRIYSQVRYGKFQLER